MKQISRIGVVSLLCLSTIGLGFTVLSNNPLYRWQFRKQPPVPVEGTSVQVTYPSNEVERIIEFDVKPGAVDRVPQFYQTELTKDSWRYRCTQDKPLHTSFERSDVYERQTTQNPNGETLEVMLGKHFAANESFG